MMVNQLAAAVNDLGGAFSPERISYSIEMTVLGVAAVFAVLAIIWFVLSLFKVFLYDIPNKNQNSNNKVQTKTEPTVKQVAPVVKAAPVTDSNDATVAAIMAAISAYIAEDPELSQQYAGGFRVVSFKRVRQKASWNTKNN